MKKARETQKPWTDALEQALVAETARLAEAAAQANGRLEAEKTRTALVIEQTKVENAEQIKPIVPAEQIWIEQLKAVRRADTETFVKLEELHAANASPRPDSVYARIRGMETFAAVEARREHAELIEWFGKDTIEQNIIVNVRREDRDLILEAWRTRKIEKQPNRNVAEIRENSGQIESRQKVAALKTTSPLTEKIYPVSSAKTDLSWIVGDQKNLNPYRNPISVVKNDAALQIVRAVAEYVDRTDKNQQLADLTEAALEAAKVSTKNSASEAAANAVRLSAAIEKAVLREEALRENLRQDESLNAELLATPEPALRDAEAKRIGETAAKVGDADETLEYYSQVQKDAEFADVVGKTGEMIAVDWFVAEARAAHWSHNAIESVTPLGDGSIDVELNPALLTQAISSFKTADVFEALQPAVEEGMIIRNISLEDIAEIGWLLAANDQMTEPIKNQSSILAANLAASLRPPVSETEQEQIRQWTFSQETFNRFEQIRQYEKSYDAMTEQAQNIGEMQFAQVARNFTTVNPSDEQEAKEMGFWQRDRQQREEQVAREKAARRLTMTAEERAAEDAMELAEIKEAELTEEQQSNSQFGGF